MLTWELVDDILADIDVGLDGEWSWEHGAQAVELLLVFGGTRVELLGYGGIAIDEEFELGHDVYR